MCVSPELGSQAHQAHFEPGFAWVPPPSSDGLPTFPSLFRLSGCSEPYAQPSHEVSFFFPLFLQRLLILTNFVAAAAY